MPAIYQEGISFKYVIFIVVRPIVIQQCQCFFSVPPSKFAQATILHMIMLHQAHILKSLFCVCYVIVKTGVGGGG